MTVLYMIANIALHTAILFLMNRWSGSHDSNYSQLITTYVLLSVATGVCSVAFAHFMGTRDIYSQLHFEMVKALLQSPLHYFQHTHFARIIGVLAVDLRVNDRILNLLYLRLTITFSAFLSNIAAILIAAALMRIFAFLAA